MFHEFRAKIEHQKKEGLPYAFLMMSLSTAVKQQLGIMMHIFLLY